jgi:hypothetical protein
MTKVLPDRSSWEKHTVLPELCICADMPREDIQRRIDKGDGEGQKRLGAVLFFRGCPGG